MNLVELHNLITIHVGNTMLSDIDVTLINRDNIEEDIQDLIFCEDCHRYHILLTRREGK